jgi:hypothetical protein
MEGRCLIRVGSATGSCISIFENMMGKKLQDVIYRGIWQGLGKMYNIKVEDGYTTIIVKPGEDLKERSKQTKEDFARRQA